MHANKVEGPKVTLGYDNCCVVDQECITFYVVYQISPSVVFNFTSLLKNTSIFLY